MGNPTTHMKTSESHPSKASIFGASMRLCLKFYAFFAVVAQAFSLLLIQFVFCSVGHFWSHFLNGKGIPTIFLLFVRFSKWGILIPIIMFGVLMFFIISKRTSDKALLHFVCITFVLTVTILTIAFIGVALPIIYGEPYDV